MPPPYRALRNDDRHQTTPDLRPNSLVKTRTPTPPPSSHFPQRPGLLCPPRRRKEISPRAFPFLLKANNPAFLAAKLCRTKIIMAALVERPKASVAPSLEILPEQTPPP